MKCKVIKAHKTIDAEKAINEWFQHNPKLKIKFITQCSHGHWGETSKFVTTIFYEE